MRALVYLISLFPFPVLHGISNLLYFAIYRLLGYRKKVVRDNLLRSFPDQTPEWRLGVERKFYRNFCDVMLEVMKTTTISREAFLERCKMVTPETARDWYQKELNVDAISSHLANWEWFALGTVFDLKYECYAVYKPLTNERMNQFIISSRGRFGLNLVPMKSVREFFTRVHPKPYLFGLLADQAPQNYEKAYEVEFLNQKTYYAPGPGLLAVKYNLQPCWGWMRRVGRSRYEWGMDPVSPDLLIPLTESEVAQIARVSKMHEVSLTDSERGYRIVKEYSRLLEVKIKMAPEDWLWSHRRWKNRS